MSMLKQGIPPADKHIVTVQEALEPLYVKLEIEADARLIREAVRAGWSAEEAVAAIEELRRQDLPSIRH